MWGSPRRLVPASLSEAEEQYPLAIISLARGTLECDHISYDGLSVYLLTGQDINLRVLEVDFLLMKKIAARVLSPFPSEPFEALLDRTKALVRVEFAGRGAF